MLLPADERFAEGIAKSGRGMQMGTPQRQHSPPPWRLFSSSAAALMGGSLCAGAGMWNLGQGRPWSWAPEMSRSLAAAQPGAW